MWNDEIRIASDGTWYYNGNKMFRMEIVGMLSAHLQYKDDQYYVCWMRQEMPVVVEDVPFVITGVFAHEDGLEARLMDERVIDLPETEVFWQDDIPYLSLFTESRLDTKLSRSAFWQITPYLVEKEGRQWIQHRQG